MQTEIVNLKTALTVKVNIADIAGDTRTLTFATKCFKGVRIEQGHPDHKPADRIMYKITDIVIDSSTPWLDVTPFGIEIVYSQILSTQAVADGSN